MIASLPSSPRSGLAQLAFRHYIWLPLLPGQLSFRFLVSLQMIARAAVAEASEVF